MRRPRPGSRRRTRDDALARRGIDGYAAGRGRAVRAPRWRRRHPRAAYRLDNARTKLALFLTGWLGGPPLYVARYGHPRLRARHLPFPIASAERDQWLACTARALDDHGVDAALKVWLMDAFFRTADWMRNRPG